MIETEKSYIIYTKEAFWRLWKDSEGRGYRTTRTPRKNEIDEQRIGDNHDLDKTIEMSYPHSFNSWEEFTDYIIKSRIEHEGIVYKRENINDVNRFMNFISKSEMIL